MHEDLEYRINVNDYMNGTRKQRKMYPAVSVGVELASQLALGNHHNQSKATDFHVKIYNALITQLGSLNKVETLANNGCTNRVGHCAENYAASKLLKKLVSTPDFPQRLNELSFTWAVKPRTWDAIDWCANCHTIFD